MVEREVSEMKKWPHKLIATGAILTLSTSLASKQAHAEGVVHHQVENAQNNANVVNQSLFKAADQNDLTEEGQFSDRLATSGAARQDGEVNANENEQLGLESEKHEGAESTENDEGQDSHDQQSASNSNLLYFENAIIF